MHIVACQSDILWEDAPANHGHIRSMLGRETIACGSLIVLPEMFATGFSMEVDRICDRPNTAGVGASSGIFLGEMAGAYQSCVVGGLVTRDADGMGRNQAVAVGSGGREITRYTKMHPFTPAGEDQHYRAGDRVVTFEYMGAKVSPLICYDLRFPERFREAARCGAEVFLVIANWPDARAAHWSALLKARAIENQAYVVGVNRVGCDPSHSYPGLSAVIDPQGNTVSEAGDQEAVLHAELDLDELRAYRRAFPFLADMRDNRD